MIGAFRSFVVILVLAVRFQGIDGGKILGLFPTPSISHQVPYLSLMEALLKRGHQVTIMTTDPISGSGPEFKNLTQIDVRFTYKTFREGFNFVENSMLTSDPIWTMSMFSDLQMKYLDQQLTTPGMQKLLNDPTTKFDVCIIEIFGQPLYATKERFNCSLVLISSLNALADNFHVMGSPSNAVAYTSFFNDYVGEKSFRQRLHAVYQAVVYYYIRYHIVSPKFDKLMKKYFNTTKHMEEFASDPDLMILNLHQVLGEIRPTVPTIVYMGSSHLKAPKPLPQVYLDILDKSKNGVIYFSLGSNVQSVDLPLEKRIQFLEAFKELPYEVIWKWESDDFPDKPSNVYNFKWLPQNDILAHPKIKLFITQGGQQSFDEAMNYKVPMICIPFVGDQFLNAKKIVKFNMGLDMTMANLNKEAIKQNILNVIENPIYRQSMIKMAEIIKDQPQQPVERAVWWIEYIIRHGGTEHLKSPRIPLYQYYFLDIIAFLIGCLILALAFIYIVLKFITGKISNAKLVNGNANSISKDIKKIQ